jgi:hypothetical protein
MRKHAALPPMSTQTYRLPDFLSLLSKNPSNLINPHFKEAEASFKAWIQNTLTGDSAKVIVQCSHLSIVFDPFY